MAGAHRELKAVESRQSHALDASGMRAAMKPLYRAGVAIGIATATIAAVPFVASATPSNLVYSTYYGGPGSDMAYMAAVAPAGGAFATGFLTTSTTVETYVSEYTSAGKVAWSTILTGAGTVVPYYIRADATAVYVVGVTGAANLPARTNTDP